ncbi:MAG: rhodanese-like domain-containing protein, partial [Dehalococcoidia bacterium]
IIHCGGRTRSIIGTRILHRMGLSQIVSLKNGTMGWLLAGYQLQTETKPEPLPTPSEEGRVAAEEFATRLAAEDQIPFLPVSELQALFDRRNEETLYLIDVRTSQEYEKGHIPGFNWSPGGQAVQRTDEVIAVRDGTIVLACDARARATVTASWYKQMGFPTVFVLDGGVTAWEERGLSLEEGWPAVVPAGIEEARAAATAVTPGELKALLDGAGAPVVIDLETSIDFKEGHLPGAHWIPRGWLELRIGGQVPAKDSDIVLTCRDGLNSMLASVALGELGYTKVRVLEGGTVAWAKAGLTLETGLTGVTGEPDDVVIHALGNRERMERYLRWEEDLGKKYSD